MPIASIPMLLAAGVSFDIAARILGHSNVTMLRKVYARLSEGQLGALAEQQIAAGPTVRQTYAACVAGRCPASCKSVGAAVAVECLAAAVVST